MNTEQVTVPKQLIQDAIDAINLGSENRFDGRFEKDPDKTKLELQQYLQAHGIAQQPQAQEAVACRYDGDGYGYLYIDNGSGSDWRTRNKDNELLYTAPPSIQQLIGEIDALTKVDLDDFGVPYPASDGDYMYSEDMRVILDKWRTK